MRFAFVVRREPEHSLAQSERARPCTIGTCHQRDATVQKTRGFDGHHARKRAFGRFGGLLLISHSIATGRMLVVSRGRRVHRFGAFCDRCSAVLRQSAWGGDPFCCRPTHTRDSGGRRMRAFDAGSCSINHPQRITAQHEEFRGSLKRLGLHIRVPSLMAPFQSGGHKLRSNETKVPKPPWDAGRGRVHAVGASENGRFYGPISSKEIHGYEDNFFEPKRPISRFSANTTVPSLTLLQFWYLCLIGPNCGWMALLLRASSPRAYHTLYPVCVPRPARSFHASFGRPLARTPLRFPCPSAPRIPGQGTFTPEHDSMHGTYAGHEPRASARRLYAFIRQPLVFVR